MIQKKYYKKIFLHIKGYIQFERFFLTRPPSTNFLVVLVQEESFGYPVNLR